MGAGDHAASMSASKGALDRFRTAQAPTAVPAQPVNLAQVRSNTTYTHYSSQWGSADSYWAHRDRGVTVYHVYDNNPMYYYSYHHSRPYYGTWDSLFLTALLVHAADSNYYDWAYAHRYDPGYQQWIADQRANASGNAQMQQQLNDLQAHVSQLEAQHAQPQAADTLPQGIDPAAAIAPAVVAQDATAATSSNAYSPADQGQPMQQAQAHSSHVLLWMGLIAFGCLPPSWWPCSGRAVPAVEFPRDGR
jgi:hypothetical protein